MSPLDFLGLLNEAVKAGLAIADIIPWAKQRHPELRLDPLPDAAGDMYASREAAIHRAYQGAMGDAVALGIMSSDAARDVVRSARAEVPDSPEAAEVYGSRDEALAPRKEGA